MIPYISSSTNQDQPGGIEPRHRLVPWCHESQDVFDAAHADFEGLPVVFWWFFAGKTMGKWWFIWTNPAFCSWEMAFNGGLMVSFYVFFGL